LSEALAPTKIALGEHVPNRVIFKNYLQARCAGFVQVDAVRVAGVSEFIAPACSAGNLVSGGPHVGDMGSFTNTSFLFNHIALEHEVVFLEHIPHLREHFVHPCDVSGGVYRTPEEAGASSI